MSIMTKKIVFVGAGNMATRLALALAPTPEIMAVTQVPMFWPMMMGIAAA